MDCPASGWISHSLLDLPAFLFQSLLWLSIFRHQAPSPAEDLKNQLKKIGRGLQSERQFHLELELVGDALRKCSREQQQVASAQRQGDAPPRQAEVDRSRIGLSQKVPRKR